MRAQRGFSLADLLVAMAVAGLVVAIAVPPLQRIASRLTLRIAAQQVVGVMREARLFALRQSQNVGVKFRTDAAGNVRWALYLDGDGDGVRTDDIDKGIDPMAAPERTLDGFGRSVRLGFPPGPAPRDPSDRYRRLDRLDDPIRFNRSDLASFTPMGGATPGSVYLTDGVARLMAVRTDSRNGRVRILEWDRARQEWLP
jgi:type II secretory pathway pseudopilin PulG